MLVITLTADDTFSPRNRKNLPHSVQVQLYKKQEKTSQFFGAYLKSTSNIKHFQKKNMRNIVYVIFKLETNKNVVRQMSEKTRFFRTPCDSKHIKQSEKLHHSTSIRLSHDFDES